MHIERPQSRTQSLQTTSVLESLQEHLLGERVPSTQHVASLLQTVSPEDVPTFVDGAVSLCQRLHAMGRARDAIAVSLHCATLAGEDDRNRRAWRAATAAGIILADTGDYAGAIAHHARALRMAVARRDIADEARTWNNVGGAFVLAGAHDIANACFDRTLDLDTGEPSFAIYCALVNGTQCDWHLGYRRSGIVSAHEAFRLEKFGYREAAPYFAVLLRNYYARLLALGGRIPRAKVAAADAVAMASVLYLPSASIESAVAAAVVDVTAGDVEVGLGKLRALLLEARKTPIALTDTLAALAHAELAAGNGDRAEPYLHELAGHTYRQAAAQARHHLAIAMNDTQPGETSIRAIWAPMSEWDTFERLAMRADLSAYGDAWRGSRVGDLVELLALEADCHDGMAKEIGLAARLHDVGMMAVSRTQRAWPGSSTHAFSIAEHVACGRELMETSTHPRAMLAADIAQYHHEHWDGSGYPDGLMGTAIPRTARMCAIADVAERAVAMDSSAIGIKAACELIRAGAGTRFDPELARLFVESALQGRIGGHLKSDAWRRTLRDPDLDTLMKRFAL